MEYVIDYALVRAPTNVVKEYHSSSQYVRLSLLHQTSLEEYNFDIDGLVSRIPLVNNLLCEHFSMFLDSNLVYILLMDNLIDIALEYKLIESCFLIHVTDSIKHVIRYKCGKVSCLDECILRTLTLHLNHISNNEFRSIQPD